MMRTAMLGTVLGLACLGAGPLQAQAGKAAPPVQQEAPPALDHLIRDLGDDSFKTRLRAEEQLRQAGDGALPALQRAAEQSADPEVQWRARRLVRQIERGGTRGLVQRSREDRAARARRLGQAGGDIEQQFDELFRQMEQRFGLDIPRRSFFHDDFFRDLQAQVQNGTAPSQGLSMEVAPDGHVRVEVRETDADGKQETKVYEAPDMESFRAQYPEVLQRGGLGFGGLDLRLWGGGGDLQHPFFDLQRGSLGDAFDRPVWRGLRPGTAPTDRATGDTEADADAQPELDRQVHSGQRLGVAVRQDLSAELREHLGLEAGVGLMVQSVAPDSLASRLGLQAGDIVTRIGTHAIGAPADVQEALAGVDAGTDVRVSYLRKGVERQATATKPATDTEATPGEGLRRRSGADGPAKVR